MFDRDGVPTGFEQHGQHAGSIGVVIHDQYP